MELILTFVIGANFVLMSYFKAAKLVNPVSLIVFIWFSLLVLSNFSLTGLDVARPYTKLLLFSSFLFLVLGSFFSFSYSAPYKTPRYSRFLLIFAASVAAVPLIIISFHVFEIIVESGYYGYLSATRWAGASIVDSYGSTGIFSIVFNFSRPVIYAYFFVSAAMYFNENRILNLLLSGTLMLVMAFILSARVEALTVVFVMFSGLLLGKNKLTRSSIIFFVMFSGSILFFILFVSYTRTGGLLDVVDIVNRYFTEYHTLGFTMFDKALHDDQSLIHQMNSYGMATVSGLGFLVKQVLRLCGEVYLHPSGLLRAEMSEPIVVGRSYITGELKTANAFYTVFYGFYADFRFVGLIVFPFIFGFFLMRHHLSYLRFGTNYSFAMVLFLTWTGYNSLFHSAVLSDYWWFSLGLIFIFERLRIYVNRNFSGDSAEVKS